MGDRIDLSRGDPYELTLTDREIAERVGRGSGGYDETTVRRLAEIHEERIAASSSQRRRLLSELAGAERAILMHSAAIEALTARAASGEGERG